MFFRPQITKTRSFNWHTAKEKRKQLKNQQQQHPRQQLFFRDDPGLWSLHRRPPESDRLPPGSSPGLQPWSTSVQNPSCCSCHILPESILPSSGASVRLRPWQQRRQPSRSLHLAQQHFQLFSSSLLQQDFPLNTVANHASPQPLIVLNTAAKIISYLLFFFFSFQRDVMSVMLEILRLRPKAKTVSFQILEATTHWKQPHSQRKDVDRIPIHCKKNTS